MALLIIFIITVSLAIFGIYVDADMVTFVVDMYRRRYVKYCFKGKCLWIVGASSGIGEHLVYNACKEKANTVVISSRRIEQLNRVKDNAKKFNDKTNIIVIPLDLKKISQYNDAKDAKDFMEKEFNRNGIKVSDVDYLVLNAGVTQRGAGVLNGNNILYCDIFYPGIVI